MGTLFLTSLNHFSQFCIFQSSIETTQPVKIIIQNYAKYSEQRFLRYLSQLHWESLLSGSDVDKLFPTSYNKLNKIIYKHAPNHPNANEQVLKSWITKGITRLGLRNELFFSVDRDKYKVFRYKILQTIQVSPYITKNEVTSCGAPQDSVLSPLLFLISQMISPIHLIN